MNKITNQSLVQNIKENIELNINNINSNIKSNFNILEYHMPFSDEEKVSNILKTNTYFQDQNTSLVDSILNEIMYIIIPKDAIIYDLKDISNYFYIINKGKATLIKEKKEKNEINNEGEDIIKELKEWDSFGEISFFTG